jgi:hypothetical protein
MSAYDRTDMSSESLPKAGLRHFSTRGGRSARHCYRASGIVEEVGEALRLNLLLTISGHHRTSPTGHACAPSPHSFRWRLFDLSAWWSKRHVGRQRPPRGKSAFRIPFDDCGCLRRGLADGGCDYLGLFLNVCGALPFAPGYPFTARSALSVPTRDRWSRKSLRIGPAKHLPVDSANVHLDLFVLRLVHSGIGISGVGDCYE